jgi:hypothetical protein
MAASIMDLAIRRAIKSFSPHDVERVLDDMRREAAIFNIDIGQVSSGSRTCLGSDGVDYETEETKLTIAISPQYFRQLNIPEGQEDVESHKLGLALSSTLKQHGLKYSQYDDSGLPKSVEYTFSADYVVSDERNAVSERTFNRMWDGENNKPNLQGIADVMRELGETGKPSADVAYTNYLANVAAERWMAQEGEALAKARTASGIAELRDYIATIKAAAAEPVAAAKLG